MGEAGRLVGDSISLVWSVDLVTSILCLAAESL